MKSEAAVPRRRTGRPLSFDRDRALHQAMLLFWRHGYEATSLADLTAAMGVTPPSIYAAFGDKKGLFRRAVARYLSGPVTSRTIIDDAPTAREAAAALMRSAAIAYTGTDTPPGCLLATSAISCSAAATDVQSELAAIRREVETRLAARIAADIAAGHLPPDPPAADLAAHVVAVIQGMSTLARDGAPRDRLLRLAETAMRCWPGVPDAADAHPPPAPDGMQND